MENNPTLETLGSRSGEVPPEPAGGLDPMLDDAPGSRLAKAVFLAMVIGLAVLIWMVWGTVQNHLGAVAMLEARGASVEWEINRQNWTTGGVSRVSQKKRNFVSINTMGDFNLAELSRLHRPVELDLSGVDMTDAGFAHLEGLQWLEILDLRGEAALLKQTRPKPGNIEPLGNPQVANAALAHLRGLKRLRELNLAGRAVTDDGLANLAGLPNLKVLDLSGTLVSDAGMRHLLGLARLEELNLRGAELTDQGLVQLAALPRLKTLTVYGTNVTPQGIFKLLRLRPELDVYHDHNVEDVDKAFQ